MSEGGEKNLFVIGKFLFLPPPWKWFYQDDKEFLFFPSSIATSFFSLSPNLPQ